MLLESVDLRDADDVARALEAGAAANQDAPCRRGSIDVIDRRDVRPGEAARLIATGDLHDNPLHLMRLVYAAGLERGDGPEVARCHLVLHELIHGESPRNGMDFSYRVLARVAALKAAHPTLVHTLLANHELSQLTGNPVMKDGVRCNDAFDDALDAQFGKRAEDVREATRTFIRSMPLGLRCVGAAARSGSEMGTPRGDVLCAHSLPSPELMDRFDLGVLERDLTEKDYQARRGSAHLMVWGRGHTSAQLAELGERWGVGLFILGHEKAENGVLMVSPNTVVLNSDHERGVYWPIDLGAGRTVRVEDALDQAVRLGT